MNLKIILFFQKIQNFLKKNFKKKKLNITNKNKYYWGIKKMKKKINKKKKKKIKQKMKTENSKVK